MFLINIALVRSCLRGLLFKLRLAEAMAAHLQTI